MPTSAVTGTKAGRKDERTVTEREADDNATEARVQVGQPLADPSGNGTVQVTAVDGSITNIDAAEDGWKRRVAAIDPKHPLAG